jgi:hypothetical protein
MENFDPARLYRNKQGGISYALFPEDGIELGSKESGELLHYINNHFYSENEHPEMKMKNSLTLFTDTKSFWVGEYTGEFE